MYKCDALLQINVLMLITSVCVFFPFISIVCLSIN